MIYRYSLGKNGEDRCFTDYFGIESPYPKFFYTTELNVETVKETLKEKFCKKHGMNEFTSESYISATKDSGEAQNGGERSTFFTEVSKYINDIDKKEIKEMQFKLNSKEQPDSWICLRHCSGSGSNEETFIYMPNIEYLHSCKNSDIDSDLDLYDSFMNITGDNIFRLIEEVSERPNKFSELSELKDTKPEFKLLNENLDCIDIFVYDISVVKKIKDKFDEDYEEPINEEEEEEKLAGEEEEKKEEKEEEKKEEKEENAEENSEEKEKEEKKENEEEKTAGEEELILNGQKIKKIRIVGEKLESDPTNWRYVISKGGEELIIYPDLSDKSDKSDDEVVAILLEINKDGDSKRFTYKYDRELVIKSKSYELRDFLSAFEDESKQIENAKEYIKSWEQFKSIPANIIGESNISTLVFGKELNNSMNYGEIIEQYTETSDTKSAEEKEEGSSKEDEGAMKPEGKEKLASKLESDDDNEEEEKKEENAEENSEEKEKEEKKENEEEKTAGKEELILNGKKIKNIRVIGNAMSQKSGDRRYVISKGGEELIIYPSLAQKKPDEIVKILLEINAKAQDEDNNETLSKFIEEHGRKALEEIEKAAAHVKSWKQFKSTPAQIFGIHVKDDVCRDINNKAPTNSMNYGEIIKLYTETSNTKAAEEKKEDSSKEEKRIEYREKEKKEREKRRTEEKKEKKLSTECIKQITDKMTEKVSNYWGELGYNFLRIAIKIMPDEAKYKNYMRIIRNNYFTDLEQFGFSDKENIKSLQKIVETKFGIDKSSEYGRTAYGIVLIATALAYYDYCLSQSEENADDALHIITKDLPKTIKNLDRTGLRNTTIAKKNCLTELNKMLEKIEKEAEAKKQAKEEKTQGK